MHRVSWENIIKPDETLTGEHGSTATGVIKMDDRLIVILDFEAIVASKGRLCSQCYYYTNFKAVLSRHLGARNPHRRKICGTA
uniref:chemotaxis protein CheW n=1 Tax=Dysosmobacter welbionis TaxID=2093857 RepID=UPI003FEFE03A